MDQALVRWNNQIIGNYFIWIISGKDCQQTCTLGNGRVMHWEIARSKTSRLSAGNQCRIIVKFRNTTCYYVSKASKVESVIPSQQGCALLCASAEALAEPVLCDGEADPVWAALTGAPRMVSKTKVRSKRAQMGVEGSWSHHKDLVRIVKGVKLRSKATGEIMRCGSYYLVSFCAKIYRFTHSVTVQCVVRVTARKGETAVLTQPGRHRSYSSCSWAALLNGYCVLRFKKKRKQRMMVLKCCEIISEVGTWAIPLSCSSMNAKIPALGQSVFYRVKSRKLVKQNG